jgi:aryl-alcohol dehydrogenase-like predicted oxidoreductase
MTSTFRLADNIVHRVGFGAMQLPGPGVFGPPRDHATALRVLRRAVELGVDHIDTAQFYGPDVANQLIFEALHPYPEQLVLVTKVGGRRDSSGGWLSAQRPDELRAGVLENLASLSLDRIPVVNLRRHPGGDVDFGEQLDAMIALRDEGLIGGVGLSTVTIDEYRLATARTTIACVQNAFSVVDRSDVEVFNACRTDGVAYVPYFPLGSAFNPSNPVLGNPAVQAVAQRLGATPAQVALAWLLAAGDNVLLIPGTSSMEHLEENVAAQAVVLTDADLAAITTP